MLTNLAGNNNLELELIDVEIDGNTLERIMDKLKLRVIGISKHQISTNQLKQLENIQLIDCTLNHNGEEVNHFDLMADLIIQEVDLDKSTLFCHPLMLIRWR